MNQSANHIRIVMIIGTARPGNFTSKAAVLVVDELKAHPGVHVEVFDPRHLKVAFPGSEDDDPSVQRLRDAVKSATGGRVCNAGVPRQLQQYDEAHY